MALLLAPGCGSNNAPPGNSNSNSAALSGQSPMAAQGGSASVSAQIVGSDGKLTALADAPVTVDATGRYQLDATVAAGATNQLVITSKSGATTLGSVVVEGGFAAKGSFKVTPIDASSTAEANLLVGAKSSGQWGADFTFGELRGLVSDDTAALMGANQTDLTAAQAAAVAALAPIAAWRSMLAAGGLTGAQQAVALANLVAPQALLDTQLDAASSADQKATAQATYFASFLKAHSDAGATVEQLSAAASAATDTMNLYATGLEANLRGQVMARAAALSASMITQTVTAELQTLGAGAAAQQAVATAATTLNSDIAAAATGGANAQAALAAAWLKYRTAVEAQLATAMPLTADLALALKSAIAADVATLTAARSMLSASASAATTAAAESAALEQFINSALSHAAMLTAGGLSAANATAYLNAMLATAVAGGGSNSALLSGQIVASLLGGAMVTVNAALIAANGQLTALVDMPVAVNAMGQYQLPVTVPAGATNQIMIVAKNGTTVLGSVAVEGGFAADGAFKAAPIDTASTAESNLLVNAKISGQWGSNFTLAEMRGLVGDGTAALLGANQANLAAAQAAAVTALAPIASWRSMLALDGFTAEKYTAVLSALVAPEATLDTQLDAASGLVQQATAATTYLASFIKAYGDAGATAGQLALAAVAASDTLNTYASSLEVNLRGQVMASAATLSANLVAPAVMAELQAVGGGQAALQAVTMAGTTLNADIAAAATTGASAQAAIQMAWATYATAVNTQLASALAVMPATALAVQTAITMDVATLNTARAALSASATAAATATAESAALQQFTTNVMAHSTLLTTTGISAPDATAYLQAVLQIDAAGGVAP